MELDGRQRIWFRCQFAIVGLMWVCVSIGTLAGTAPLWPPPKTWATLGFACAAAHLAMAWSFRLAWLQFVTVVSQLTALSRVVGYLRQFEGAASVNGPALYSTLAAYGIMVHVLMRRSVGR